MRPPILQAFQPHMPINAKDGALSCPKLAPLLSIVMNMPESPMMGKLLMKKLLRIK